MNIEKCKDCVKDIKTCGAHYIRACDLPCGDKEDLRVVACIAFKSKEDVDEPV